MAFKTGVRTAAAALACMLALSTPVKAFSGEFLTGTSDMEDPGFIAEDEFLGYGTMDGAPFDEEIASFDGENGLLGEAEDSVFDFSSDDEIMLLSGVPDTGASVDTALQEALTFLQKMSQNLIVGSVGGEWSVIALARNNLFNGAPRDNYMKNLIATVEKVGGKLDARKYTEYSRVTLALGSMGIDARYFGEYDLVSPLFDFDSVCVQGVNGPIWALIALDSGDYAAPDMQLEDGSKKPYRDVIIDFLLENQLEGGGWALGGDSDPTKEPDDLCPMAIQALAPYYNSYPGVKEAVDTALNRWSGMQKPDGGFGKGGNSGQGGSEAVSQTIVALSALDVSMIDDENGPFVKNGVSLLNALLSYQLPDGSFRHVLKNEKGEDVTEGDGMATDQAVLALTAYMRAKNGQPRIYDMTAELSNKSGADHEQADELKNMLNAIPNHPTLNDRDAIYTVKGRLYQIGNFRGRTAVKEKLAKLQAEIEVLQAEVDAWNAKMKEIVPAKFTLDQKDQVIELRELYNQMPVSSRAYLDPMYASNLLQLEEKIIALENEGFPIQGEAKTPASDGGSNGGSSNGGSNGGSSGGSNGGSKGGSTNGGSSGGSRRPSGGGARVTTTVESNTIEVKAKDGIVSASELEKVKGQERNLRITNRLSNGKDYTMTIHGTDIEKAADVNVGIKFQSEFEKEIQALSENPFIFSVEHEGYFPGPMLVEMPVDAESGLCMLLRYNEAERRAEYLAKPEVKDGRVAFTLDRGGDYFLAKKAISKSLDELEAAKVPETTAAAATEPAVTTSAAVTEVTTEATEEILVGTGPSFNVWIAAGIAAAVLAAAAVVVLVLLSRRKVNK